MQGSRRQYKKAHALAQSEQLNALQNFMPRGAHVLAVICGEISFHLAHKTLKQLHSNACELLVTSDARSIVAQTLPDWRKFP